MSRILGFIKLIRPVNGLMMGVAVIVGASLVLANQFSTEAALNLLLGFVTAFTLTAASMAINDYCDREIDRINEPARPIPSGQVKPKEALIFTAFLAVVGLVAAAFTNRESLAVAVFSLATSLTYASKGKRTGLPGNFLVSACVATPFIYGSFAVGMGLNMKIVFFAVLAFLSNTGREVAKGIVDVEGDRKEGMMTIAVSHGEKVAAYVASAFFLSAVLLTVVPPLLNLVTVWFIPFVAVADLGFIGSAIMLIRDYSRSNARRVKNFVLVWMLFGMISFFAGTI
ncbi:hypothetical protein CW712_04630 [Candidatus Bathyarchaeota archaeon]|nr:MAG: hypothetical protein CW712_04630 [Candidatus Bathyarchaeota archaeon]